MPKPGGNLETEHSSRINEPETGLGQVCPNSTPDSVQAPSKRSRLSPELGIEELLTDTNSHEIITSGTWIFKCQWCILQKKLKEYNDEDKQWIIDNKKGKQDVKSKKIRLLLKEARLKDEEKLTREYPGPLECTCPKQDKTSLPHPSPLTTMPDSDQEHKPCSLSRSNQVLLSKEDEDQITEPQHSNFGMGHNSSTLTPEQGNASLPGDTEQSKGKRHVSSVLEMLTDSKKNTKGTTQILWTLLPAKQVS
jgi:hypothetical protein